MNVVGKRWAMHKRQRGVALLEVLIAFFVLSVGLMGLAALQVKAVQFNQGAYQRSQAMMSAADMMDRMRLNRSVAVATTNNYNTLYDATAESSPSTVVAQDIAGWLNFLAATLPGGDGEISCVAVGVGIALENCTVKVRWADRFSNVVNPAPEEIVFKSRI